MSCKQVSIGRQLKKLFLPVFHQKGASLLGVIPSKDHGKIKQRTPFNIGGTIVFTAQRLLCFLQKRKYSILHRMLTVIL